MDSSATSITCMESNLVHKAGIAPKLTIDVHDDGRLLAKVPKQRMAFRVTSTSSSSVMHLTWHEQLSHQSKVRYYQGWHNLIYGK